MIIPRACEGSISPPKLKGSYDAMLKIIICVFGVTEYVGML